MTYTRKITLLFFIFITAAGMVAAQECIDKKATKETINLYRNLEKMAARGIMFGHQDDLAYGLNANGSRWIDEPGRSDVKTVTGDYPAVYGWELGGLESDALQNLDGVDFNKMRKYIQEGYARGGVITISWHLRNPVTGKTAWDSTGDVVKDILPGASYHAHYKEWLGKIANFLLSLRGSKGELIPVLFRPYHEFTGNWFWWGQKNCTAEEFKKLWQFTVDYFRNEKGVHNLLYVYNTSGDFNNEQEYLERYAGDDYADILSFDAYYSNSKDRFIRQISRDMDIAKKAASEHKKLLCLAETGNQGIAQADWWTDVLWTAIQNYPISYVLVWRNGRPDHYYTPYEGQVSAADFIKFHDNPRVIFQQKLAGYHIYK